VAVRAVEMEVEVRAAGRAAGATEADLEVEAAGEAMEAAGWVEVRAVVAKVAATVAEERAAATVAVATVVG
jgi:hypothetical protein